MLHRCPPCRQVIFKALGDKAFDNASPPGSYLGCRLSNGPMRAINFHQICSPNTYSPLCAHWHIPAQTNYMFSVCNIKGSRHLTPPCKAATKLFRITLYSHGLWLGRRCMISGRDSVLAISRGCSYLAKTCVEIGFPAFSRKTTVHSMHHFAVELDQCLQRGAQCYPSLLLYDCCQCEDFIGSTARMSRATHSRATARCVQHHLLNSKRVMRRAQASKRKQAAKR